MKKNYIPVNKFHLSDTYFDGIDPFIRYPRHVIINFFQSKNVAKIITIDLSPELIPKCLTFLMKIYIILSETLYYFHMQNIYL